MKLWKVILLSPFLVIAVFAIVAIAVAFPVGIGYGLGLLIQKSVGHEIMVGPVPLPWAIATLLLVCSSIGGSAVHVDD